jgi:hypothetical protein
MKEFKTLGTPNRVIPDRIAKGKFIPGKTIPGQPPRPASKKTKLHVKAFLQLMFESAMKWKIIPMQRNPLKGRLIKIHGRKKKVRPVTSSPATSG